MLLPRQPLVSRSSLRTPALSVPQSHSRKFPPSHLPQQDSINRRKQHRQLCRNAEQVPAKNHGTHGPTLSLEPHSVAVSRKSPRNKLPLEMHPTVLSAISTTSTLESESAAKVLHAFALYFTGRVKELDEIAKTLDFIHE
jgi:hypothetical protein